MATPEPPQPGTVISARERQVVAGVARGRTNEEIGDDLGVSEIGVKSHLRRISRRYDTSSRSGVVGEAYRRGDLAGLQAERRPRVYLAKREQQVLDGMSRGLNNAEIGRELFLAEDTIKTYARRLFIQLRASGRAHAVALGYQHGHLKATQKPAGRAA